MSFRELSLLKYYKTYKNDIIKEFYTPVLAQAVLYQRAVGFFSSTALIDLTKGFSGMIKNGGRIQFIVSPLLSQEDIDAINKEYEKKKIIGQALMREFREPENYFQEERLNWLSYLIEEGFLEIKVAFTPPNKEMGMYHEKVGIVTDELGNKIVFTGSLNETINAFHNNYESIVVFNSWEESKEYADEMQKDFESLWNNEDDDLEIIEFPDVIKEKFKVRRKEKLNLNIDEEEENISQPKIKKGIPHIPDGFTLREYQIDAIESWRNHEYRGIFDMATGTGKTYTGLGAVVRLFEEKKRLAIIIVCPYQHLVEQWVEDIELFNMTPTIGYSASKQKNWKKRLENDVLDFLIGVIDTFCFVTTNATYSTKFVSDLMEQLGADTLLVVDEAHNFGSPSLKKRLYPNIAYRLALSATLDRHGDEEGTLPTMIAFTLGFIIPFVEGVYLSFCKFTTVNDAKFVGFANYAKVFTDETFVHAFWYTAAFTVVSVILINVLAFAVALLLTKGFKGTNIFRTVFFMPNLIGGIVLGYIWQLLLNGILMKFSRTLTYSSTYGFWGLIILMCWQQIGYMMIIYIAGIQNIPGELIEAAEIDGATKWQILKKVTIPMVMPSITVCTFLTLTNSFKLFDQNLALTNGEPSKMSEMLALNIFNTFYGRTGYEGVGQAKAVIFFILVTVIALTQNYLTRRKEVQQ